MGPTTSIVVLMMLDLTFSGGLVALVARRSLQQRPLLQCAASTGLFALPYAVRLALGMGSAQPPAVAADVLVVFAAALFLRDQRQYMGRTPPALGRLLMLCGLFGVVHAVLALWAGQAARHISLNGTLGILYGGRAFSAWQGQRLLTQAERPAKGYYAPSSICILLMGPSVLWWMFTRLNGKLHQLATQDPLTGVLDRNGLAQVLQQHFRARRPAPKAWLMLGLDHFKRVNDTLGHRGGDRLRAAVAALHFTDAAGGRLPCTASIGASPAFGREADWEPALRQADAALYAAKAGGRNRVAVAA